VRAVHWLRSDLRLDDNRALAEACRRARQLALVFVLDPALLASERAGAPRVRFLLDCLARLAADLEARGSRLVVRRGEPVRELARVLDESGAELLVWNRDYSPFAKARDARVEREAARRGVRAESFKDRVAFESGEVRTKDGKAFSVYTPFRNAWRLRWSQAPEEPERVAKLPPPIPGLASLPLPAPETLAPGAACAELPTGGEAAARRRLERFLEKHAASYAEQRDLPAEDATSRLSPYLRFGAISVRRCLEAAFERARERHGRESVQKWIDELLWRDFYAAILDAHPHVLRGAYRREYDAVRWNDDREGFAAWCEGRTGYPIVDAGMRQLAASGWMHNRVRMLTASFLAKDLLVDWRLGERFFYRGLVDGDPASNNGGWQWAASTGTDPQPWFRIFNPVSQGRRFDPDGAYVRRFLPELRSVDDDFVHAPWLAPSPPRGYPAPIVDHAERRAEALRRFEAVKRRGPRSLVDGFDAGSGDVRDSGEPRGGGTGDAA
jgi:deoxyribodipyrimidine photo-lyase